jgi:RNA-directed DNA polymerase
MKGRDRRERSFGTAESETLGMCGNSMRENREALRTPTHDGGVGRSKKAKSRNFDMHVCGESDGLVVPTKRANKAVAEALAAESAEERRSTKGNAPQAHSRRTQSRGCESQGLWRVRQAARRDRRVRFTALLHHITPQLLRASYWELNRLAAPGIDGETWKEYRAQMEVRILDLHERVQRGTYRAKPSKRAWIPKAGGQRPLGIAALEDKIVQKAVRSVLEEIFEVEFLGFSYGFRPGRSAHEALDALWVGLMGRRINWVLDCDIRGFFDAIVHEWLMKFIEHRVGDRRVLRLIRKWLRAGVSEDGQWSKTVVGTPQGSVISPFLANVYLHYVLDLWVAHWRKHHAQGDVIVVRYADDFVMGFQNWLEAERCLQELRERLRKFGLELHPEKTRLIEFGRFAAERRSEAGLGKPETFSFLGFTHYCGTTWKGAFTIKRQSMAKRMRAKLLEIKAQLKRQMHSTVAEMGAWLRSVVWGWLNYHAVPGNSPSLGRFRNEVGRIWFGVLRRRSQKFRRRRWQYMARLIRYWLPPARIVHPYPNERLAVIEPEVRAV